jgi:predicted amidohydrolase YtcJ
MTWEGPGFVDHHVHLLRYAAKDFPAYDLTDPASIAEYHRSISSRWSTPMDEQPPLGEVDDLPGSLERGLQWAADLGLVQVTEAGITDWRYLDALLDRREKGLLPVRVRVLAASGIADARTMPRYGDPWVEVIGVKFYADGWLGPRTCALCQPFTDDDDNDGVLFLDADTLAKRADPFAEAGWVVATHAIGDRAIEAVLDAYERIFGDDCAAVGPRIEHAQVLRPDLVERMAHLGVVACIQPGFAVSDAASARAGLGRDRMEHAYGWRALLAAGVPVIAGSDFPIESLSPLEGLRRLVAGVAEEGGEQVAETLPLDDALAVMTDASAGTTLLSDDPHDLDPHHFGRITVEATRPA